MEKGSSVINILLSKKCGNKTRLGYNMAAAKDRRKNFDLEWGSSVGKQNVDKLIVAQDTSE